MERKHNELLIQLPGNFLAQHLPDKGPSLFWCFKSAEPTSTTQDTEGQWTSGTIQQLQEKTPEIAPDTRITVFIPTEWVLLTEIKFPSRQRKHVLLALPFAVEEQLATDIDDQHLATLPELFSTHDSSNEQLVPVTVIKRDLMQKLVETLTTSGITPDRIIPTGLTLRLPDGRCHDTLNDDPSIPDHTQHNATLVLDIDGAILRCSITQALSSESCNALFLIQSWLHQLNHKKSSNIEKPNSINFNFFYSTESDSFLRNEIITHLRNRHINIVEHSFTSNQYHPSTSIDLWQSNLNLLQGEFILQKKTQRTLNTLKRPTLVASVFTILYLGYFITSGMYYNFQAKTIRAETRSLYRNWFPEDRRIINIRTQTLNHLKRQINTGDDFSNVLRNFVRQWQPLQEALKPQQIRFSNQRQEMIIELKSETLNHLETLHNRLQEAGLQSELLSATEQTDGTHGRLKISIQ